MRYAAAVALFAAATSFGFSALSAAQTVVTGPQDVLLCRPAPVKVYTATISGEIKDKEAAKKLRSLIKTLSGVVRVTVDIEAKTATITMDRSSILTKEDVEKALKDSGFGVTGMTDSSLD